MLAQGGVAVPLPDATDIGGRLGVTDKGDLDQGRPRWRVTVGYGPGRVPSPGPCPSAYPLAA
jgi:hypothetical protein